MDRDAPHVLDIAAFVRLVRSYVEGVTREDFMRNVQLQDSVASDRVGLSHDIPSFCNGNVGRFGAYCEAVKPSLTAERVPRNVAVAPTETHRCDVS